MYDLFECVSYEMNDGVYAVDWGGVYTIAHAHAWASARLANARAIKKKQWFGPDLIHFETDLDRAKVEAEQRARELYRRFRDNLESSSVMEPSLTTLKNWLNWQRIRRREYWKHYQFAVSTTQRNILRTVERGETAVKVAQFVRDASFDALLIMATIPVGAGGLQVSAQAWRALTAVSGLKGMAKYLETENTGAAVMTFTSSMTFGAIGIVNGGQNWVVGYLAVPLGKGAAETSTAMIEGKKLKEALISGAKVAVVESAMNGIGLGIGTLAKFLNLENMEIPVQFMADRLINLGADALVERIQAPGAKQPGLGSGNVLQYHVQRPGQRVHDARLLRPCITDATVNSPCLLSDDALVRSLAIIKTGPPLRRAANF